MSQAAYIRVSSIDQKIDRQLIDIEGIDKRFIDKCSGGSRERPALKECLNWLRSGDVLHVHSIDRLARNLADLELIIKEINEKGASVNFHKENLVFKGDDDMMQRLMLQMMGAFAEFERAMIRSRQAEGIAAAKAKGVKMGPKRKFTDAQVLEIKERVKNRESKTDLAKEYKVTRQTIYTALNS